jgi:hypothetical protein
VLVVALSGLMLVVVASPAAASSAHESSVTVPSQFSTESTLQVQGFFTPHVFYRLAGFEDIVVVYDGGGPADPVEAIRQIQGTVWGLERVRFDRLVIQNGNQAPLVVGYADLEASIGPRPAGFEALTLQDVAALGAAGALPTAAFSEFLQLLKVVVAVIGVTALLAVLAFGLASFLGSRRRDADESADRLFV